jgi:myxalamid-type polyketide synthase MxaC
VSQGARHIVLIGRTGLPERAAWDAAAPASAAGRQIAAVRALEASGAHVMVASADVADWARMSDLWAELRRSMPPVRGVIHAAGVMETRALADLDARALQAALRPKVLGTWVLHQLTLSSDLQFFVCFSSVTALWGSQQLAHYVAANQFMDALAHYRRGLSLPALSVNWGPWEGSGPLLDELARHFSRIGLRILPAEVALAALGDLLERGVTQRAVASVDWTTFSAVYQAKRERPLLEHLSMRAAPPEQAKAAGGPEGWLASLRRLPAHEQRDGLLSFVRRELAGVLGYADATSLDPRLGFFRLGMDSLQAVQLRNRLSAGLGHDLPPTIAFEYPTAEALARHLADDVLKLPPAPTARGDSGKAGGIVGASQAQQVEPAPAPIGTLTGDALAELLDDELARVDGLLEDTK